MSNEPGKKPCYYGGQAVIEGVMMRGKEYFAVACRRSNDEITVTQESLQTVTGKFQWLNKPFLRGTLALVDAIGLGIKALLFSANLAMDDIEAEERKKKGLDPETPAPEAPKPTSVNDVAVKVSMVAAVIIFFGIFFFTPIVVAAQLKRIGAEAWRPLAEGGTKLLLLLGYVSVISLWPDVKRVYRYHGAEHKVINAYEAGEPLDVEHVRNYTTIHVRCGTSFLLVVILTSIIVFLPLTWNSILLRFIYKMLLLPVVAGIAYEIIRLAGGRKRSLLTRIVLGPGLLMQKITTQEPDDKQIEIAIAALKGVLDKEQSSETKENNPEGACPVSGEKA